MEPVSRCPRAASWALVVLLAGGLASCDGTPAPGPDACDPDVGCGPGGDADVPVDPGVPDADVAGDQGPADVDLPGDANAITDPGSDVCVPDCAKRECGSDGCGGFCGWCQDFDQWCDEAGVCNYEPGCREGCMDGDCGVDPCGQSCPGCAAGESCVDLRCQPCPAECTGGCTDQVPCCMLHCTGRQCGDDGCGGVCGTCDGLDTSCGEWGLCGGSACDWATQRPTSWGPAAVVTSLQTPADADVVEATCFDFTGDGLGNNGFRGLAGQVNGPLADAIARGDLTLLLELSGVIDFANTPSLALNGLAGRSAVSPPGPGGDFEVLPGSYVEATCRPQVHFEDATIANGHLVAGPADLRISYAILPDLVVDWTMVHVTVRGTITGGDAATGFQIADGVLSGVVLKKDLDGVVDRMTAYCDPIPEASRPAFCPYLYVTTTMGPTFFDLHDNGDGTFSARSKDLPGDATSICGLFQASRARILGFPTASP